MSVNFDCQKCIHAPVCMYTDEAASEIEVYKKNETVKFNLTCKYYASVSITKDAIYCK